METVVPNFTTVELKVNEGFDGVAFGASMEDVRAAFGDPEETEMYDEDEETDVVIWHYWDKGFSAFFEQEAGFNFSCVEISNTKATAYGKGLFTLSKAEISDLFTAQGFKELETETHEWGEERLSVIDAQADFYFEDNKLVSVNIGKLLY